MRLHFFAFGRLSRLATAVTAAGLLFAFASVASGEVIEIAPDGTQTLYNGPAEGELRGVAAISLGPANRPAVLANLPDASRSLISSAALRYAIDPDILQRLAWRESAFRNDVVSRKGAIGIMQLMPATARDLGVNPYDISQNILGGAAYLRQMLDRFGGDRDLALAAYNAGPSAVIQYHGIPPFVETRNYVRAIVGELPASPSLIPFVIFVSP